MSSSNSPKTLNSIDDLVSFIAKSVSDLYEKNGQQMDGSLLAYNIRSEYPGLDYMRLGLTRLGDAVRIAENRNLVIRNRHVNHLQLSPPDVNKNAQVTTDNFTTSEHRYVRNDVWRAFVFQSKSTTFLDRETFKLSDAPDQSSNGATPNKENDRYLEIKQIPDHTQISWAKQYTSSLSDTKDCSDDDAKTLLYRKENSHSRAYYQSWKKFFSAKVVDYIRHWAEQNGVPTDQILVPIKNPSKPKKIAIELDDDSALRHAIIAAIREMPLSDLDDIAIPIKYIRRHFTAM